MLLGLDLAPGLTGYCVGEGADVPLAGAWPFEYCGDDLGQLAQALWHELAALHARRRLTWVLYEAPLLMPHDTCMRLRKLYGMGVVVELFGKMHSIQVREASVQRLKRELAGKSFADKDAMVAMALKAGIELPKQINEGRRDAADAFAAWLIAVRLYAREHLPRWDRVIYGARGALL